MASELLKDKMPLVASSKRMAKGKKKPARKTGPMGTPKKKTAKKRPARKTRK
jgi:hypothetical protein